MIIKNIIKKIYLNIRFLNHRYKWQKLGGKINKINKKLLDYSDEAGKHKGHYFIQDILVAKYIYSSKSIDHLDIGSRLDGFVAHVAVFRTIDILDIRPLKGINNSLGINFIQGDITKKSSIIDRKYDSISCLHSLEHIGMGRYGDIIDPLGHISAISNIIKLLNKNGTLYISVPIANKTSVHFNAHRIFSPIDILKIKSVNRFLKLIKFDIIDDYGNLHYDIDPLKINFEINHSCGIFTFKKRYD